MPDKVTLRKAKRDQRQGKAASTQAGEFIREEMHHIRQGKHGARSTKQAIAIGLSKARRAGVDLLPPQRGTVSEKTRKNAARAYARGHGAQLRRRTTAKRSRAALRSLQRESHGTASHRALSTQSRSAARRKTPSERSTAAAKAARTREIRAGT